MRLKWYGTATLLVESGNTRILIDPYLKKLNPKLPRVPIAEAATAQAVVITHPHLDHFCDIGTFIRAGIKEVHVSQNGIDHARAAGISTETMIPFAAGDVLQIGSLTVRALQSRHCKFDLGTILGVALNPVTYFHFHDGVEILKQIKAFKICDDIYALDVSDGERHIMILGSAGMDRETEYPTGADLFVFPYQGRMRMHRYMTRFLERFQPKAVMLDHFDDAFPPISGTVSTKKFLPTLKKHLPEARGIVPREGEWYEV